MTRSRTSSADGKKPAEPDLTAFTYIFGTVTLHRKRVRAMKQIIEPTYKPKYERVFWFTPKGKAKLCDERTVCTFREVTKYG